MKLKSLAYVTLLGGALIPGSAVAADFGTAAEAKAMLERAVAELKKNKAAALAKFRFAASAITSSNRAQR